jgi:NADH-quinone oxidoreductase subunit H
MAITSLEVYGVIIAGWASNSKYAFLGALRASAQMVSYEIAMGFCFVVVLMVSASLNMTDIVMGQGRGHFASMGIGFLSWNWLSLLPIFLVYFISGLAETNRHPFDVVEGESEIVAGHMIEYSGLAFAMFFLAEYANMWLVSVLAVTMFLGGWDAPISFALLGMQTPQWIVDSHWFWDWAWLFGKTFFVVTCFLWVRATFPRFRYDQIMNMTATMSSAKTMSTLATTMTSVVPHDEKSSLKMGSRPKIMRAPPGHRSPRRVRRGAHRPPRRAG